MPEKTTPSRPWLPPRWAIRAAWRVHRRLYKATGGRLGLSRPKTHEAWGTMRVTTMGRKSGREHAVMLAYLEDGPNLIGMAMNGWGEGEPAWWLNLKANPDARVQLPDGPPRDLRARPAVGEERARLWDLWRETDRRLDALAASRSTETTVVVFEAPPGE